ncbi:MAG TPA: hypothetical protein VKR54_01665 [Candidatus Babeliales bacterium]|jgi:hypothetical protein|nr:hypothetical protein [Candidatus Babeliales bacterium]
MYFIARNNAIYNYIAHTNLRRCYSSTLLAVGAFFVIGMYGVYYPLIAHITLLQSERMMLQKKIDESEQLDKSGKELLAAVESGKKNIADYAIASDKHEEHCHKRMLFVLDTIAQSGLTLSAYGACKEKDKVWYTKDSAHFDIVGPMQKLMTFLETMKNSRTMIAISQVTITRNVDDTFQMSFDIGLITVKK